jgi:type II secretion system protein E
MSVRIGELLLKEKRITPDQLQQALNQQKANGGKLGFNLVRLGFIKDEEITALLSKQYGVPSINLPQFEIDPAVIKLIPPETALKYQIIPLSRAGATLTIAMTDPTNVFAMDDIKFMTGYNVEPVVASETAVAEAVQKYYPQTVKATTAVAPSGPSTLELASKGLEELQATLDGADNVEVLEELQEISAEALARQGEEAPVVRLVNVVLMSAIQKGASDIHIEPYEKELRVRYRIDGILYNIMSPPMKFRDAIASRLKIMAKLDIAEKRLPQDGRFTIRTGGKDVDLRVSVLPTSHGERVVLRILEKETRLLNLSEVGLSPDCLRVMEQLIHLSHGMILVTGPTGSGKTTTLYAALSQINAPDKNIITVEDPVEYQLQGISQMQVNPKINLSFAAGLRSILRQDPDVIMIGEIRDLETAEIAIHASLTGHLVFSTLHTNDAAGAVTRLIDMGIEPFLVSSSAVAIIAQRLVRVACAACRQPYEPTPEELARLGLAGDAGTYTFYRGAGCPACAQTGYRGRHGIYELLVVDDEIRRLITAKADAAVIKQAAIARGMRTLKQEGATKVVEGLTTTEEIIRITQQEVEG